MRHLGNGVVEAIDRNYRESIVLDPESDSVRRRGLPIEDPVWDAAWDGERWLMLTGDSARTPRVTIVSAQLEVESRSEPIGGFEADKTRIGVVHGVPTISGLHAPFAILFPTNVANAESLVIDIGFEPKSTIAMRVLDVGPFALQSLVDVTSLRRGLRVLDMDDKKARLASWDLPLTFLAVAGDGSLVGLRITDKEEIVRYSWRWR